MSEYSLHTAVGSNVGTTGLYLGRKLDLERWSIASTVGTTGLYLGRELEIRMYILVEREGWEDGQ